MSGESQQQRLAAYEAFVAATGDDRNEPHGRGLMSREGFNDPRCISGVPKAKELANDSPMSALFDLSKSGISKGVDERAGVTIGSTVLAPVAPVAPVVVSAPAPQPEPTIADLAALIAKLAQVVVALAAAVDALTARVTALEAAL